MFIHPTDDIYEGMVVGMNSRDNDISVNVTKAKNQTNVRSSNKDQTASIKTPRDMTLEESMEFLDDDEYAEVTPENVRIRKQILNTSEREKAVSVARCQHKVNIKIFLIKPVLAQLCGTTVFVIYAEK